MTLVEFFVFPLVFQTFQTSLTQNDATNLIELTLQQILFTWDSNSDPFISCIRAPDTKC